MGESNGAYTLQRVDGSWQDNSRRRCVSKKHCGRLHGEVAIYNPWTRQLKSRASDTSEGMVGSYASARLLQTTTTLLRGPQKFSFSSLHKHSTLLAYSVSWSTLIDSSFSIQGY